MSQQEAVGRIMRIERGNLMRSQGVSGWEKELNPSIQSGDWCIGDKVLNRPDFDLIVGMVLQAKRSHELDLKDAIQLQEALECVRTPIGIGMAAEHSRLNDYTTKIVNYHKHKLSELEEIIRETITGNRNPEGRYMACKIAEFFLLKGLKLKSATRGGDAAGPFTRCVRDVFEVCNMRGRWKTAAAFAAKFCRKQDPEFPLE